MNEEGSTSFFEKKEAKKLYPFRFSTRRGAKPMNYLASPLPLANSLHAKWIKVFCFFFSKKKCFFL